MLHGKLLLYLGGACSCYLDMLNEAQEQLCRTDDPTLSLELPLAHHRNPANQSIFYRYYFGNLIYLSWSHFSLL